MIDHPLLSVQEVSKNYGAVEALKGVSFELRRGEVGVILIKALGIIFKH